MKSLILPVFGFVFVLSGSAPAQDTDKAAAIAAFDEAQALMAKGDIAAACSKFGQSQKLDPQLGTLLHWAHCLEQNGQIASAWSGFREAADLAQKRGDARQQVAAERAASLQPRLSRLQLELPDNPPEGLRITRNGVPVVSSLWGTAVPVDPGTYAIEVTAPGYKAWQGTIEIAGEGSVTTLSIPLLEPDEHSDLSPASGTEGPVATTSEGNVLAQKWPAFVAGGVGLAGAAVWAVFGLKSMDAKSKADGVCEGSQCSTPDGVTLRQDAIAAGNVATVGMVVAGVGLASAAVLWFTLPSGGSEESPVTTAFERPRSKGMQLGVGPGAVQVQGVW